MKAATKEKKRTTAGTLVLIEHWIANFGILSKALIDNGSQLLLKLV